MPKQTDTKNLIINTALDLFSMRGYDGVGMRDIAHNVGIRESAIYKHFAGKQELFDTLVKQMSEEYTAHTNSLGIYHNSEMIERYKDISENELVKFCCGLFFYLAKDERAVKFRKILTMEQFKNDKIGKIYRDFYFEKVLEYQSTVFKTLIDANVLIQADYKIIALQFYAPIFLLLTHYNDTITDEKEIINSLTEHVKLFIKIYSQRT